MAETALEGRTDGQTTCKARRCRIKSPHDVGEVALISNAVSGDNIVHVICFILSQTLSRMGKFVRRCLDAMQ